VSKYSNLKLARPLWEGDQEVVKRSGRDEPIWVAIYMCMEATLGISLYSHLQACKNAVFLTVCYVFSTTKLEKKRAGQVLPGSKEGEDRGWRGSGERGGPNNIYSYE
jgi:hypothetical protein